MLPGKRPRRGRRFVLVCLAVVTLYGLIGALALPPLAKKIIADRLEQKLGRAIIIDDLSINPFTLSATMKGLRIFEPDLSTPFAAFDTLDLDGSIESLFRGAPVVDAVALSGLHVNVVRDSKNQYNFSDILARFAAEPRLVEPEAQAKPPEFSFANIRVTGARVDFDDKPKHARHQVTEIDIAIPFISILPAHLKEYVQPAFSARVNGTPLSLSGETMPFDDSLETHLDVNVDALDLHKYLGYSPVPLPLTVDSALIDAQLKVVFTQSKGKPSLVRIKGRAALRKLAVSTAADQPLAKLARLEVDIGSIDPIAQTFELAALRLNDVSVGDTRIGKDWLQVPKLAANGISLDLAQRRLTIADVTSVQGALTLRRRRDGSLELPVLARPAAERTAAASPALTAVGDSIVTPVATDSAPKTAERPPAATGVWAMTLKKFSLTGYSVSLADATVTPAAAHRLTIVDLQGGNLTTEKGARGTLSAQLGINKNGSLVVASTLSIDPPAASAEVDARGLDLAALRPYIAQIANVDLSSGTAALKGAATVRQQGEGLRVTYAGAAEIANLASTDKKNNEDLLKWGSLKLADIKLDSAPDSPFSLSIAAVALDRLYSRLVINPDGKFNLQELRTGANPAGSTSTKGTAAVSPAAPGATPARNVRIDKITFINGRLNFSDHFVKPNYSADLTEFEGTVSGLSSVADSHAVIALKGRYDPTAPVTIDGTINPLRGDLFLDIKANGRDIELPAFTAYSQKYAGYGITQGKLTLDVSYRVEAGKLEAQNNILLSQLTFGDHVDSPEATTLPVLFVVSLLKNSRGEIELSLPVSGSLDDPQFSIAALVGNVIRNLLTKAVTAPFALLGAAFGGAGTGTGGEELAYVEFDYGVANLTPAAEAKLRTLTQALQGRPGLKLELAGRVDPLLDVDALKKAALERKVKSAKRDEMAGGGKALPEVDSITIDAAEYPKYLKIAYAREKFAAPLSPAGPTKDLPLPEMEAQLRNYTAIGEDDLRGLAQQRAERAKTFLLGKGKLLPERLIITAAESMVPAKPASQAKASRVDFTLQ